MASLVISRWMAPLLGGLLYLGTTALLLHPGKFHRDASARSGILTPSNDPSWRFRNPEFEQWVRELKTERAALAGERKELDELRLRLQAERQEMFTATQAISHLQQGFDRSILRFADQQKENTRHQAKVIAGMSPEGAALLLTETPQPEAVRMLFALKPDQSAGILDALTKKGTSGAKLAAQLADDLKKVLPEPK